MIDIHGVLRALSLSRPVFASEADFQEALASHILTTHPGATVVREVQKPLGHRRAFIDLEVNYQGQQTFLELKYKTVLSEYFAAGKLFKLKHQSAQDQGRYDGLKDFSRLESFVENHPGSNGVAVFLTNDKNYWSAGTKPDCQDREFKLPEGRVLSGTLRWAEGSGLGSIKGREAPIVLKGSYRVSWKDYATFSDAALRPFKMLIVDFRG